MRRRSQRRRPRQTCCGAKEFVSGVPEKKWWLTPTCMCSMFVFLHLQRRETAPLMLCHVLTCPTLRSAWHELPKKAGLTWSLQAACVHAVLCRHGAATFKPHVIVLPHCFLDKSTRWKDCERLTWCRRWSCSKIGGGTPITQHPVPRPKKVCNPAGGARSDGA